MTTVRLQDRGMKDWDPLPDDDGKADIWLRIEAVMVGVFVLIGIGYMLSLVISG